MTLLTVADKVFPRVMRPRPQLRVCYWRENQLIGNLGDALGPILLHLLGYDSVSRKTTSPLVQNPRRCLIVIGSLLTELDLGSLPVSLDVWGCGWKGVCPPSAALAKLRIHAVRGPHTVAGLGLPANTPMGDPALLLPHLAPRTIQAHNLTLVVPHIQRMGLMSTGKRRRLTGCDELLSTQVIQAHQVGQPGWQRQVLSLGKAWLRLGVRPYQPWGAVERIAGASFVLTGSLHGAILAQTYGVPWAAYDDGYINVPAKWLDWAAYLGIRLSFVKSLIEGERWWQLEGRHGAVRDLQPLLDAFPYPLLNAINKQGGS